MTFLDGFNVGLQNHLTVILNWGMILSSEGHLSMPRDIFGWGSRRHYWLLAGTGQGCFWTFYNVQDQDLSKPECSMVLRMRNPKVEERSHRWDSEISISLESIDSFLTLAESLAVLCLSSFISTLELAISLKGIDDWKGGSEIKRY